MQYIYREERIFEEWFGFEEKYVLCYIENNLINEKQQNSITKMIDRQVVSLLCLQVKRETSRKEWWQQYLEWIKNDIQQVMWCDYFFVYNYSENSCHVLCFCSLKMVFQWTLYRLVILSKWIKSVSTFYINHLISITRIHSMKLKPTWFYEVLIY